MQTKRIKGLHDPSDVASLQFRTITTAFNIRTVVQTLLQL